MIRHTKFTKSSIPALIKQKTKKKISKKILSSCGTPRKVFSKSTSRNGSPYPTSKSGKRLTIPKVKTSANSTRIKMDAFNSYVSPNSSSSRAKKQSKQKFPKPFSGAISPRENSDYLLSQILSGTIDSKEKLQKYRGENEKLQKSRSENEKQMKSMLQKLLTENMSIKNKLKHLSDNQEEPKSTMNFYTIDSAMENIKQKLRNLKKKFI